MNAELWGRIQGLWRSQAPQVLSMRDGQGMVWWRKSLQGASIVTGLHRSRRPVPCRLPSFPFKRAKVVYTQGGGSRSSLPASRHPPRRRGRVREGRAPTQLRTAERQTDGHSSGGSDNSGVVEVRKQRESGTPNLEKGVTWGPGAES